MTRYARIKKQYIAEFHAGECKAGRIHIYSTTKEIMRQCRESIATHHRRDFSVRDARKAYYLGAFHAIKQERKLCAHFKM